MKYTLLIKAEAIQDMKEAFEWYEQRRTGLGTEFLDEVGKYFSRIEENPEHYEFHRYQRIAIMRRFITKLYTRSVARR